MSNFDGKQYQLKRAMDNLKLAEFRKEIAELETIIANARGFGAKRKIQQAEAKLEKLRPQMNALIAQMQLEDAKIKASLLQAVEDKRQELEREKQREHNRIKAEQRKKEKEEKERLKAEKWASLTPEEQQAEKEKDRRNKNLLLGIVAGFLFLCFGCGALSAFSSRNERVSTEDTETISMPIEVENEMSTELADVLMGQEQLVVHTSTPLQPTLTQTATAIPTETSTPTTIPTSTPTSTPTPVTLASVIANGIIFNGPGEIYDPVGEVSVGDELPVYAKLAEDWYLINWNGVLWINAGLVSLETESDIPESESIPPTPTSTPLPTNTPTVTFTPTARPTNTPRPTAAPNMVEEATAKIVCKDFVRENLRSPSTADFGRNYDILARFLDKETAASLGIDVSRATLNNVWVVIGEVDAQNAFGAVIRSDYMCVMEYRRSEDTWYLLDILIESR